MTRLGGYGFLQQGLPTEYSLLRLTVWSAYLHITGGQGHGWPEPREARVMGCQSVLLAGIPIARGCSCLVCMRDAMFSFPVRLHVYCKVPCAWPLETYPAIHCPRASHQLVTALGYTNTPQPWGMHHHCTTMARATIAPIGDVPPLKSPGVRVITPLQWLCHHSPAMRCTTTGKPLGVHDHTTSVAVPPLPCHEMYHHSKALGCA